MPKAAKTALRIDWRNDTAELITWGLAIPAEVDIWYGGVSMPDGRIYGVPPSATPFLVIDPLIRE